MHGMLPKTDFTRSDTTVITSHAFSDTEDAVEAGRLCRVVTAHLRSAPDADPEDLALATARLVRIAQRATIMRDDQSRTRCSSPMVTGVRWTQIGSDTQVLFASNDDQLQYGQASLTLTRLNGRWTATI